jgi:CBS domain-containing protein
VFSRKFSKWTKIALNNFEQKGDAIVVDSTNSVKHNGNMIRRVYMTTVREIMTSDVETCSLLDNVFEVAQKMKQYNVGAIPIVDGDRLVGMITDRDIVIRCIAEKHPPSSKVQDIMSEQLVTVSPDTPTDEAARLMSEHQIRRLPVVDGERLVGIVSLGDFAVRELTDNQAKQALSEISEPSNEHYSH